jgi:hypothetical protein
MVVLLPPCCGRGADCPHLSTVAEPRQWPDGHEMDLRMLLPIPASLASYLRTELRQPRLNQQQEMEMGFKTLLGAHYHTPTDSTTLGKRAPLAPLLTNDAPRKQQKHTAAPAVESMPLQLGPLGLVPCTISEDGGDGDSESSDSEVEIVEGTSDADSDHELDYDNLYDEDQLEYEAALESDAYCSDGSW